MVNRQKSRLAGLEEKLILLRIRLTAAGRINQRGKSVN